MKISNIIQEILKEKGMTVKDLSKLIDVPYTTLLRMMKRGLEKADVQIFIDICKALGQKPEDIIKLDYDNEYYQVFQEKNKKGIKRVWYAEDILNTMDDKKKNLFKH
ncbi:MAG TPA: helix-turn-helix transcriptional regulator [Clostridia bacterium]